MFKIAKPFFMKAITSVHAGSGSDLGIVDLPIQRERHTSFPKIESSTLKGCIREAFEDKENSSALELLNAFKSIELDKVGNLYEIMLQLIFGYDEDAVSDETKNAFKDNSEFSGCLAFTDARILFFPVKSAKGVFAYITCPYVLKRFKNDMMIIDKTELFDFKEDLKIDIGKCITINGDNLSINDKIILEEYTFTKINNGIQFNIKGMDTNNIVVLSDDDFKDFVNLSTEVITRTKIENETGTVKSGALFNEEYLPPESILYYIVFASPVFHKNQKLKDYFKSNGTREEDRVMQFFEKGLPQYIQVGGNATLGKGIIQTKPLEVIKNVN